MLLSQGRIEYGTQLKSQYEIVIHSLFTVFEVEQARRVKLVFDELLEALLKVQASLEVLIDLLINAMTTSQNWKE